MVRILDPPNSAYVHYAYRYPTARAQTTGLPEKIMHAHNYGTPNATKIQNVDFLSDCRSGEIDCRSNVIDCRFLSDCRSNVFDCRSGEIDCRSNVIDCRFSRSGEIDCRSTVIDCRSGEIDCRSNVIDCRSGEIDCRSNVIDCRFFERLSF